MRGHFIAFDGLDGSGKGTQISLFKSFLGLTGRKAVIIPSLFDLGPLGHVRDLLLSDFGKVTNPTGRQMLCASSYVCLFNDVIEKQLASGVDVLLDRCVPLSTVVYGLADGVQEATMDAIQRLVYLSTNSTHPDICFVFDVNYATAFKRLEERQTAKNHYDEVDMSKFTARRQYMLRFADKYDWCHVVNAEEHTHIVHQRCVHEARIRLGADWLSRGVTSDSPDFTIKPYQQCGKCQRSMNEDEPRVMRKRTAYGRDWEQVFHVACYQQVVDEEATV